MSERWFRYAPNARVADFEAAGWRLVRLGGLAHHDLYSTILEWPGPGEPPPGVPPVPAKAEIHSTTAPERSSV